MGTTLTKNKCDQIKVQLTYPSQMNLEFVESPNTSYGSKFYKFKIPKKNRFESKNFNIRICFQKVSFETNYVLFRKDYKKVFLGTDKYYYDSEDIDLEKGQLILRFDKNMKLAYIIVYISNPELNSLSF